MAALEVIILASDNQQRAALQAVVDNTAIARTVYAMPAYPVSAADLNLRRIQDTRADVVLIDVPSDNPIAALKAIDLLRSEVPKLAIFACGDLRESYIIISAMRAGACEFLDRPATKDKLLEALIRLTSGMRRARSASRRGKIYMVVNAKGGSGATTVAVNTALSLQTLSGSAALVDMAPLGHAAVHLNLKPAFTVVDAARNLQRLDSTLLHGFMMRYSSGMQFLAGPDQPAALDISSSDFAHIFDILASEFHHVIVDVSTRLDHVATTLSEISDRVLVVSHADVPSLWSAAKVQQLLGAHDQEHVGLVLNRFRKIPGFNEADIEAVTHSKLLWKIPNQYAAVSQAIDRGTPVVQQNHSEIAKSFIGLAAVLNQGGQEKRRGWSIFSTTA